MILRQARRADAAAICEISNPIIRDSTITFTSAERDIASVSADIAARGLAFQVVEVNGKVAGFATYGPFRSGPGYRRTCEHSIQLAGTARGKGLGRLLMQRLESVALAEGIHVMVAGISATNPPAVAFHQALGFSHVGRLPEVGYKNGVYLDLILMQKLLQPGPDGAPDTLASSG